MLCLLEQRLGDVEVHRQLADLALGLCELAVLDRLLGGLLNGPLIARSIYTNSVYRQIPGLPTGGSVRLVPRG